MSKNSTFNNGAPKVSLSENLLAEKIEHSLKNMATRQWRRLEVRGRRIKDFLSSAGHVNRRYKEHQSLLNRFVDGYNRTSLLKKAVAGLVTAAIGAFAGVLIFHTAITLVAACAVIGAACYLFFAAIMTHHGLASQKCEETLFDEISALESEVDKTVSRLKQVENGLNDSLISLDTHNTEMAEQIEIMGEKASALAKQNQVITKITDKVQDAVEKLELARDSYKEDLSSAHQKIKQASMAADKLESSSLGIARATNALSAGNEKLEKICGEYQMETDNFRHINLEFDSLLIHLKTRVNEDTKRRQDFSKPVCSTTDVGSLLSDTDTFLDECLLDLEDMEKINHEHELAFDCLHAKVCLQKKDTDRLLSPGYETKTVQSFKVQ